MYAFLNQDDMQKLLKENILYMLAKIDDKDIYEFSKKLYKNRQHEKIPADLQKAV